MNFRSFNNDPGQAVRADRTGFVLIARRADSQPAPYGMDTVGYVGSVVNDRGLADEPQRLATIEDLAAGWGGFSPYLGDGSASGYEGNAYARATGLLQRGGLVFCPVNNEIRSSGGAVLEITLSVNTAPTTTPYTVPAGTRMADAVLASATVIVASLEDVTWDVGDSADKTVRFRHISGDLTSLTDHTDIDTVLDAPTPVDSVTLSISTSSGTAMPAWDATAITARYTAAFAAMLSSQAGQEARLICCDRDDAGTTEALASHCKTANDQAAFRFGFINPPNATSASDAEGTGTNGVGRSTLQTSAVQYCHPGWVRQFPKDSANLTGPEYKVTMPSAVAKCFLASWFNPEANSSNPDEMLANYKIVGIEAQAPTSPATHEQAGICQPEFTSVPGLRGRKPSYVSDVSAYSVSGSYQKAYTTRMAQEVRQGKIAILAGYHKLPATTTRMRQAVDAVDDYLQGLLDEERIGGYEATSFTWDATLSDFLVTSTVYELGNLDVITLNDYFGANSAPVTSEV